MNGNGSYIINSSEVDVRMTDDEEIAAIDSRIGGETNISPMDLLSLKSQRNSLQSINRLPVETLLYIFTSLLSVEICRTGWKCSVPDEFCFVITQVCHHWRVLALGYPKIWANITYRRYEKRSFVPLFLERSKMVNIEVFLGDNLRPVHSDVLKMFHGHMHRVISFNIFSFKLADRTALQKLLNEAGPCLKSLRLRNFHNTAFHLNFLEQATRTIQLDELNLRNVSLTWSSPLLHGLTSLILSTIKDANFRPTMLQFLDVLAFCPKLRDLQLEKIDMETPRHAPNRSIVLPCLENLRLHGINADAYLFFAACIDIPKDVTWRVNCHGFPIETPGLLIPNLPERITQCESFTIDISKGSLDFTSMEHIVPHTNLSFNWNDVPTPPLISSSLISIMERLTGQPYWNNPTEITLIIRTDHEELMQRLFWSRILALIPHIRSMSIAFMFTHDICNAKGFIEALTDFINHDDPKSSALQLECRDLESLEISCADFSTDEGFQVYNMLIDHLHFRKQHGCGLGMLHFIYCLGIGHREEDNLRSLNVAEDISISQYRIAL